MADSSPSPQEVLEIFNNEMGKILLKLRPFIDYKLRKDGSLLIQFGQIQISIYYMLMQSSCFELREHCGIGNSGNLDEAKVLCLVKLIREHYKKFGWTVRQSESAIGDLIFKPQNENILLNPCALPQEQELSEVDRSELLDLEE